MNQYKNKIVLLLLFLSSIVNAQMYLGAAVGESYLTDNYDNFTVTNDVGFNIKAGYVHMFSEKFGLGIGAEYLQSKNYISAYQRFSIPTNLVDNSPYNSAFVYNVTTEGYREVQKLSAIQIPLFLQFKKKVNENAYFYARAGVQYYIPQKFKIAANATTVNATGFYPNYNLLIDNEPSRGFGTTTNYTGTGEYETENVIILHYEFGFSFDVGSKSSVYTGFFLDKATETIVKSSNNISFIGYNPTSTNNRKSNGLYNSKLNGEVIPVNFGLTFSYSFGR